MKEIKEIECAGFGFVRVAACVPSVGVGDVRGNVERIVSCVRSMEALHPDVVVLPELSLTAYSCGDLLMNSHLLSEVERALPLLARACSAYGGAVVVGAPLRWRGGLYNCGVLLSDGAVAGVVPKSYIPNYREFYEKRWMSSGMEVEAGATLTLCGEEVPFGTDLLFTSGGMTLCIEVCEDLWAPVSPSAVASVHGANLVVNLSASNEVMFKHDELRRLVASHSGKICAAYAYASAGFGESTTDLVFDGKAMIASNGALLGESKRFEAHRVEAEHDGTCVVADIDLNALAHERIANATVHDGKRLHPKAYRRIPVGVIPRFDYSKSITPAPATPFVPEEPQARAKACAEAFVMQQYGLMRRLQATGGTRLVVGISGGLDSTLALLVAHSAFRRLGLDTKGLHGITMPGMGTTKRTKSNAVKLMEALGITSKEIDIVPAVMQHFHDIGQDPEKHDVTYENSQARERTQILMDYANRIGAMVLGTGDMSELALGWATYNGDHMSMYNVNASIPKTLVCAIVEHYASHEASPTVAALLADVLDTPISPELTPHGDNDEIKQKTEDAIGPYRLHDFFLYHFVRNGASPLQVLQMSELTFRGEFEPEEIEHWLGTFLRRFFTQQFKRSCVPDGPKVTGLSLSPRGDWRMPSDATPFTITPTQKS